MAATLAYSGFYNVAADQPHTAPVKWLLDYVRDRSIAARADGISVPDLSSPEMRKTGARHYDKDCVHCHLAPGMSATPIHQGLNPAPPNLARHMHRSPEELFWIVKRGIKMTGMPAWGKDYKDDVLWTIVAFLRVLPELSAVEYASMIAEKTGQPAEGENKTAPP